MLEKTYNPAAVEQRQYQRWEQSGIQKAGGPDRGQPFVIMMPPPNVTGSLHMGHALTMTLQDILTRFHRMQGRDALWLPGTDHAGIATQMVVERQLAERQINRRDLGREKFLEKVWEWKDHSGGTITRQLRRLGALPDWSRERFTMDEGLSKAVIKVFVDLYRQGLIYRAQRLVNWDPHFQTAISDIEVQHRDIEGKMYHVRYPFEDGSGYVAIATTRPETILADGAVAVNPNDERYKQYVGKLVHLPIVDRLIPIIADDHVDPEFGSGCVKITAAHDYNDFAVAQRHPDAKIPLINLMTPDGRMNENCPPDYQGLDRFAAREKVIADFEALGLLDKIEPHKHAVPFGDRSGVVIEPYLTDQWYVDAATLAKPALEAVKKGDTVFVPKNWENTYFRWLENIEPWCISRQLWWGHQIPAWYDDEGNIYVAETEEEAKAQAGGKTLRRDSDVLDTWFSSALWPFSTLGWPEKTTDLMRYYPGSVLVTGFDIIFFWVARMMMMGLHFMGDVPFKEIYMHALVRDQTGAKMSKSKGNIIDPLELIDKFGADAVRFTLTAMTAQGRDIKLSEQRVEGYRNFVTKIWNAARFCEMNGCVVKPDFMPTHAQHTLNRWVLAKLKQAEQDVATALTELRFNDAASKLYEFVWNSFCDWYVELAKPFLQGEDNSNKAEIQATAAFVLNETLRLLHPMMPFVTEELSAQYAGNKDMLAAASWPDFSALQVDEQAVADIDYLISLITSIRSARAMLNVPASLVLPLLAHQPDEKLKAFLNDNLPVIKRLARVESISFTGQPHQAGAAQIILNGTTYLLPLQGVIDFAAESARLKKQVEKIAIDIGKIQSKLENEQFIRNAPEEIVDEQKERLTELQDNHAKLSEALKLVSVI